jgi:hypothetical protein
MRNLLALLRDAANGSVTLGRAVIHLGRATIQVVVKIVFAKK